MGSNRRPQTQKRHWGDQSLFRAKLVAIAPAAETVNKEIIPLLHLPKAQEKWDDQGAEEGEEVTTALLQMQGEGGSQGSNIPSALPWIGSAQASGDTGELCLSSSFANCPPVWYFVMQHLEA